MSWNTPKTWAYKETLSSSDMNTYVRDNSNALRAEVAVLQVVTVLDEALDSTTSRIPFNDTIPQSGEGKEAFTLSITPKLASSRLVIDAWAYMAASSAGSITIALFRDSIANALAAADMYVIGNGRGTIRMTHDLSTGSTDATTFKVRFASESGTANLNGQNGGRKFGTVSKSGIKITEVRG